MTLKQKQAAMLKRHKRNRPWDHVKCREHSEQHYSLLQAIDSGLSDEKLCLIYKLPPSYVKWFRDVEYVLWRQRIRESLKRLDFYLTVKHGRPKAGQPTF